MSEDKGPAVGDQIIKMSGDYVFAGTIVSVFAKRNKVALRYVIENDDGMLMIMNASQFEVVKK